MQHYDPLDAPDCEEWLALDEQERIALARDYHGRAHIRVPNAAVHAAVHAIVETQIALGDETPARRAAQRLMDEGLDRHDAIHAIGSVLVEFMTDLMTDLMKTPKSGRDPNVAYFAALERLTAANWLSAG
jgi:HD superfamily phosphodiesterase